MDYNEKRAELVSMLNLVVEQLKEYDIYELSSLDGEFKKLCNRKQAILQKIELLDKQYLSV